METEERINVTMSVDPGVTKGFAIALFCGSRLVAATMEKDIQLYLKYCQGMYNVTYCVLEIPVVRQTGQQKGRQTDITDLAIACGRLIGHLSEAYPNVKLECIPPEKWKKQIPKKIGNERVAARITDEELDILPKRMNSDILDAIGIGFWKYDRERALV
jgi:hypothetical protein